MELKDLVRQELILLLESDASLKKLVKDKWYARKSANVYDLIPSQGIRRTELTRKTVMKSLELDHALKLLIDAELIDCEIEKTATKPIIIYKRIK